VEGTTVSKRQQMEDAINAYLLEQSGENVAIVKDWALVAAVSTVDDELDKESIFIERSAHTPLYAVTGLLTWGLEAYDGETF
jgi:hypothetical protein